jgi:hypothetical protein
MKIEIHAMDTNGAWEIVEKQIMSGGRKLLGKWWDIGVKPDGTILSHKCYTSFQKGTWKGISSCKISSHDLSSFRCGTQNVFTLNQLYDNQTLKRKSRSGSQKVG